MNVYHFRLRFYPHVTFTLCILFRQINFNECFIVELNGEGLVNNIFQKDDAGFRGVPTLLLC